MARKQISILRMFRLPRSMVAGVFRVFPGSSYMSYFIGFRWGLESALSPKPSKT